MGLMNLVVSKEPKSVEWIEGGILWDICMYKITGIPIAEQSLILAQDKELKKVINMGIDNLILPHIAKLRDFMLKEGLPAPAMPDRKLKGEDTEGYSPSSVVTDEDVTNALREVYRLGLHIEIQGIAHGTRSDISYLIKDILNEDIDAYINLVKLSYAKNWASMTPSLPSKPLQ